MDDSVSRSRAPRLAKRIAQLSPDKRELLQRRLATQRTRGFDLVAQSLRELGITHIYGVAGRPTEEILPACFRQKIRPIGVYHHTSAVCMALAHNYQSGRLAAVTLVSAGPAVTNAMTGMLVARDNRWPVVILGGRRSSFQRSDLLPIIGRVAKCAIDVPVTDSVCERVRDACRIAVSGRPGPVYLELHEDALRGSADQICSAREDPSVRPPPSVPENEIERIAGALLSAQHPALLLGKGVRWTVVPALLQELIEALGIPFITSPMGRGFVAEDHSLCFNQARTVLQSQADVVLVLGARLNWVFRHGAELRRDAQVFRIDIEQDDDDAAIPTDFIHGDAGDFVARLLHALKHQRSEIADAGRQQRMKRWQGLLQSVSDKTRRLLREKTDCDSRPMSPYRMMKEVRDALPRDAICVTEGNVSMTAAQPIIPAFLPAARMDAGTNGCMGVGIPFALGAKVAHPDRPVVAVTGDYGFSLSAMEMEVGVRHNIPIVIVVANNQGNNGAVKQQQYFRGDNAERVVMFQPGIEYDRMMRMFGGRGTTITDPDLLKPAIEQAISAATPYCVNVVIDPETPLANAWGDQGPDEGAR